MTQTDKILRYFEKFENHINKCRPQHQQTNILTVKKCESSND